MNPKYTTKDVMIMADALSDIHQHKNEPGVILDILTKKLSRYPTRVLEEFLHCMELLTEKGYDEKDSNAMIVYVAIRLNFIDDNN